MAEITVLLIEDNKDETLAEGRRHRRFAGILLGHGRLNCHEQAGNGQESGEREQVAVKPATHDLISCRDISAKFYSTNHADFLISAVKVDFGPALAKLPGVWPDPSSRD
jgi:hypothetical protein